MLPVIFRGAQPGALPRVLILPPICSSGVVMRPMGREESEASPKSSEVKFWPARTPARRRMPVPELPQSMGSEGAVSAMDWPWMSSFVGP